LPPSSISEAFEGEGKNRMTEKVYWGLAALLAAAIIIAGVRFYQPLLTGLHILVSASLLLVVLLQSGRAADLAGAFGGAGSQTAFGPRGAATFLSNATSFLAIVFMVTSLSLAIFSSGPHLAGRRSCPDGADGRGSSGAGGGSSRRRGCRAG
jgi:preprotein translocase subunit SecG